VRFRQRPLEISAFESGEEGAQDGFREFIEMALVS
jgi:hypothetical protein